MPVQTLAYSCQFKCGQRVVTKRASMVAHEARCICNPETRSCPTCKHNDFEHIDEACGISGGHFCAEDHLEKEQTLQINCPHWEPETK